MKKVTASFLTASVLFLSLALTASPVFAISYDFNDGTNQGWTVQFNDGSSQTPAAWFDYTNYSVGASHFGLPPVMGPPDPGGDNNGAISGSTLYSGDSSNPVISSFASPVFTAEAMETLSAQFTLSTNEGGISSNIDVWGQVAYREQGINHFYFGDFTLLNSDIVGGPSGNVKPFWTEASMVIPDGVMVDQVLVNIRVYGTPLSGGGTQNWIDEVTSTGGSGPVPAVPEPATILLLACGIIGLAGFKKKLGFNS